MRHIGYIHKIRVGAIINWHQLLCDDHAGEI